MPQALTPPHKGYIGVKINALHWNVAIAERQD
jgi:hypothetical protein